MLIPISRGAPRPRRELRREKLQLSSVTLTPCTYPLVTAFMSLIYMKTGPNRLPAVYEHFSCFWNFLPYILYLERMNASRGHPRRTSSLCFYFRDRVSGSQRWFTDERGFLSPTVSSSHPIFERLLSHDFVAFIANILALMCQTAQE